MNTLPVLTPDTFTKSSRLVEFSFFQGGGALLVALMVTSTLLDFSVAV